jgi:hypothetical protein
MIFVLVDEALSFLDIDNELVIAIPGVHEGVDKDPS